jgi:hypothetical protein
MAGWSPQLVLSFSVMGSNMHVLRGPDAGCSHMHT